MSQRTVHRIIAVPFMLLLFALAAGAQLAAIGFCALNKTLDFKTAKAGDKIRPAPYARSAGQGSTN
jgi:hypothetical protein